MAVKAVVKNKRRFLPEDLSIDSWGKLESFFVELSDRSISSSSELDEWMLDRSELEAVLEEDAGWRYIKMTIDTTDKEKSESYLSFVSEINPKTAPFNDVFNKKLMNSDFVSQFEEQNGYDIYLRGVQKEIALYREENIALSAKISEESQKYGALSGGQTIELNGAKITMQQASKELKSIDREHRKTIFEKIVNRRLEDTQAFDNLFNELQNLRDQVADNADFKNFRDYKFETMGRFDYSVSDCFDFHESIKNQIVPILSQFQTERQEALGYDKLKPYDMDVDPNGNAPLKPFNDGAELLEKSIELFYKIDPYFGDCLATMKLMGHLDLESKKGKSPGGYNYPLYEIGVPFIFMNAVGTQRDLITMVHEGGHAVHSFLSRDLKLTPFKSLPSEVAELASMSMELISMDNWDVFYDNENHLKRAKKDQLETLLKILPWVAIVDKFQHWLYTNKNHSVSERTEAWNDINKEFSSSLVDWSGYEDAKSTAWHRQLHIFEVPFYYIEYGMAQLGAIGMWRNYKNNPSKTIQQYKEALSLGYTKSIPEIYKAAGIEFNFSENYVKELASFVKEELDKL